MCNAHHNREGRMKLIHQYKNNGYNIILDVNSGSVHVVDDVVYDIVPLFETNTKQEIVTKLEECYSKQEIEEAWEEVNTLKEEELLFTPDIYRNYITDFKQRKTVVKALCLHIAHDCNLACKYCFAEEGEYHGRRALMSFEVGKKALDFLIANSGNRINLEVDFFGGEPLMNWDVVKRLVEYGRSQEKIHNKKFRFTLTTNGVLGLPEEPYAIREEDLPVIMEEYDKLAVEYIKRKKEGRGFNFFHFMIDLEQGPCVAKRLSGCGSGTEYVAVTPWGDLYPCHQFVGREEFLLGNVDDGIVNEACRNEFKLCNVYAKEKCQNCFAKFYCSGGCAANSYQFHGSITDAYEIGCEMQKKRIECAIMIKAALADEQN